MLGDPGDVICLGAAVEPGVVFDVRHGPVVLDEGVEVRHGTRLEGPLYAGPGARLLGGFLRGSVFGPDAGSRARCRQACSWATPTRPTTASSVTAWWGTG